MNELQSQPSKTSSSRSTTAGTTVTGRQLTESEHSIQVFVDGKTGQRAVDPIPRIFPNTFTEPAKRAGIDKPVTP